MEKSKIELFLELAKPDSNGISRWVLASEFSGAYKDLSLGNGGSWCRKSSNLAKKYNIEFDKSLTKGNKIDAIRLNGFNIEIQFSQQIRRDIKEFYKHKNCVMLGINGRSENTIIEIDHKNGRKDDLRLNDLKNQKLDDFQPLCKAANDIKRAICKACKATNLRFDAKNIAGNPYSFYKGGAKYSAKLGCVGCYQYDPVAYRKECVKKIAKAAAEIIAKKLYQ